MDCDFEQHRRFLTRLAYRILASVGDAEDVVQETYLRWREARPETLREPRAWLTRVCTRLALDRARAEQRRRERYVGESLPEPLAADAGEDRCEIDETLSMALLTTIQRLRPAERAAFLLHDVFGYAFAEVADIVSLESAHCRQLAARARKALAGGRRTPPTDEATVRRLSRAFFGALASGDLAALRAVLADDVALHTDGGGKVPAARGPILGAEAVARFFHRVFRRLAFSVRAAWFNGAPGALVFEAAELVSAFHFVVVSSESGGAQIGAIYVQRNPDKLRGLRDA